MSFKIKLHIVWNKIRLYLSFLLLVFYLIVGCLFLFSDIWVNILPQGRQVIGTVLVSFAALRFYIAYRRYRNKHHKIQLLKEQKANKNKSENVKVEEVS